MNDAQMCCRSTYGYDPNHTFGIHLLYSSVLTHGHIASYGVLLTMLSYILRK
jgi:hypothetical protein